MRRTHLRRRRRCRRTRPRTSHHRSAALYPPPPTARTARTARPASRGWRSTRHSPRRPHPRPRPNALRRQRSSRSTPSGALCRRAIRGTDRAWRRATAWTRTCPLRLATSSSSAGVGPSAVVVAPVVVIVCRQRHRRHLATPPPAPPCYLPDLIDPIDPNRPCRCGVTNCRATKKESNQKIIYNARFICPSLITIHVCINTGIGCIFVKNSLPRFFITAFCALF